MVKNPSTKAKTESIDEVILRLLGLKPGVEIDYQTYHDIIKKKLALGRLSGKELPREEDELLRNEFKRVRSLKEQGIRFKVKKARVKKSKPTTQNLNQKQLPAAGSAIVPYKKQAIAPKDLIPKKFEEEPEKVKQEKDNFSPIRKTLDSILKTLGSKFKFDQKQQDQQRREKESERRGKREASLEGLKKGIAGVVALTKKMLAPFDSILQRIWRFVFFTLLGRAFTKFMDWMSDKGNQQKFNSFVEFLSDHWPALAGLYILFGTGFGKLVRGLMKGAARMVVALAMSIPKLVGFIKKNKKLSFLALAAAPLVTREVTNLFKDKESPESILIPKTNPELDEAKKLTDKSKDTKVPTLNFGGIVPQVKSQESGDSQKLKPQKVQGLNLGGLIGKFIGGGITPFGGIDFQSGVPISGAGKDNTLIAAKTGEAILTEKDQVDINRRYVDKTTGQPLNIPQYLSGRKPGYVNASNIKVRGLGGGFSEGGLIEKFNQGGIVGTNMAIGAAPSVRMNGGGFLSSVGGSIRQFFGGKPKPKGLSVKGVRAGFTGMNRAGFEAISGGDKFRVATNPSLIGRGSRPVLGSGAYSAPTVRGANRYVRPGGGVIKTIVPGSAIRSSLVDIVEPQQRVAPATFDKGKALADKILSNRPISQVGGRAGQSALRTRLQQQLLSGSSTNVMTGISGLGRGSAALRVLGGLGRGALGVLNRVPMLSDMLFPEGTSSYDQLTGPNAYYNAPGYRGPKPIQRQGGGLIGGLDSFGRSVFENVGGSVGKNKGRETGLPGGGWFGEKLGERKGRDMYEQLTNPLRRQSGGLIEISPKILGLPNELGGGGGGTDALTEQAKVKTFGSAIKGFLFGESKNAHDPQRYNGGGIIPFNKGGQVKGRPDTSLLRPQAKVIFDRLISGGLSPIAAAGIVANIGVETGYTYSPSTQQIGGGPGRGLAQWEVGGRFDTDKINLSSFAKKRGTSWNDLNTQIAFILHELGNHPEYQAVRRKINQAKNVNEATKIFLREYEKAGTPHIEDRLKVASQIMNAGYLRPPAQSNKPQSSPKRPDTFLKNFATFMPTSFPFNRGGDIPRIGKVGESEGIDKPGATADRQLFPIMGGGTAVLQPGEYVLPVDTVNRLGLPFIEKIVSSTDSNSDAYLKKGKINRPEITPYSNKKGSIASMTLPPIDMGSVGSKARSSGYSGGSSAPSFSAVSPINDRDKNAKMYYGIV